MCSRLPMMEMGSAETRAREVGFVIRDLDGLTRGFVYSAPGVAPVIYLPAGWTGPVRDAEVAKRVEELAGRVHDEATIAAVWAQIVARASGAQTAALVIAG